MEMIACYFTSFGFHIIELPQEMHQALISYIDIAAIGNYKNTCKELYENIHFHMASDYSIASMATVTCLRGLIAFAQQQDQMSVKEKDSTCNNIQENFMRFLSRSDIKECLTTELVLQRIENRMTMVLGNKRLFSDISVETSKQKTLFQDNDAQDIATKLILYSQYYHPSSMYDNNKSTLLINMFQHYKKNLWPLLLAHPRVNVNLQDTDGYTALIKACIHNNMEIVKELLADQKVDVNPQDKCGYTALMKACIHNNMEIVKELLADQKIDVNLQDKCGETALITACFFNNMEAVKELLADQKVDVNLQDRWGDTALMKACAHNNMEIVKELLADQKVDVNLQNTWGETALITACFFNNIEAVKELLADPRVNVNLKNKFGCTALIKACTRNNIEIASRMRAHEHIGLMDKIIYNLYLNYGASMVDIVVMALLVGKLIIVGGCFCGALYIIEHILNGFDTQKNQS
jgi:ankyrin repeat protein